MTPSAELPVATIGTGPIGLADAAHPVDRGAIPPVLEAGRWLGCGSERPAAVA